MLIPHTLNAGVCWVAERSLNGVNEHLRGKINFGAGLKEASLACTIAAGSSLPLLKPRLCSGIGCDYKKGDVSALVQLLGDIFRTALRVSGLAAARPCWPS